MHIEIPYRKQWGIQVGRNRLAPPLNCQLYYVLLIKCFKIRTEMSLREMPVPAVGDFALRA